MEKEYARFLSEIEVMEPSSVSNLQVFCLRSEAKSSLDYLILDEALDQDLVRVSEVGEGGAVPTLLVVNHADCLLFLMSGEHLQGGKQDRVLNVSIMLDAKSDLTIPVSCVEAGRWRYRSSVFHSSPFTAHSLLRSKISKNVLQSYRGTGEATSNQQELWLEISRKLRTMKSRSPSVALKQAYDDHETELVSIVDNLPVPDSASGAVFVLDGHITGLEIFDQSRTFQKLWPKLLRSYAIDAFEKRDRGSQISRQEVKDWINASCAAHWERFRSPGLGEDIRFEHANLVGASLKIGEDLVHTEILTLGQNDI